jgi:hypothetical protein
MILRISGVRETAGVTPGWNSFAESQKLKKKMSGYISQPAHARLSAKIAATLTTEAFGTLPADVIEAIGRHDSGWSEADLAALETASTGDPASFLEVPSQQATEAWRHSIRAAEARSPLQAALTSRHFCLLAPDDGDPAHQTFVREENHRRQAIEATFDVNEADMQRYTAALGFCDLLSLLMCSGIEGAFELPLAHPAHPAASKALHAICEISSGTVNFERTILHAENPLSVNAWLRTGGDSIASELCEWRVE